MYSTGYCTMYVYKSPVKMGRQGAEEGPAAGDKVLIFYTRARGSTENV